MGHAVNKILKDIVLKQKIISGKRVHYRPGWDCHGLPIELKALRDTKNLTPMQIRQKARKFAEEAVAKQKKSFESWGVVGSWNEQSQTYRTFDKDYIKNQLRMFFAMYQKRIIYRDLKPVFWSPSSGSALAEAELEYDNNYLSPSLYFRCQISNSCKLVNDDQKVYALVWTTTPWTLPANQAICFNVQLKYCLVKIRDILYIVGADTTANLAQELESEIEFVKVIDSEDLKGLQYHHPINQEILPFFNGSHVQADKGTGLVHTAPSHGPDDFLVFLNKKIPLKRLVNEQGCYNSSAPEFLQGKEVLGDGNQLVINYLESNVVMLKELKHAYPIDWRTKKPVIIMASEQWFINTEEIKAKAIGELEKVEIHPQKTSQISKNVLQTQLEKRPYWCISRQRSWGVPIPVLYNSTTKEAILNESLLEHWSKLIDETGSIDFWWERDVSELVVSGMDADKFTKGNDILDIWFDSGVSWSFALDNDKVADLYLEGVDQFTGWFQSSLMTSIGIRGVAPYKNIFVHGFAVDESGKKMSKSLGNVISPEMITKKYGTDTMRWWIAGHAAQHSQIPVSYKLLEDGVANLIKIRATLKYLLGVIESGSDGNINEMQLTHLDKFILYKLTEFNENVSSAYEGFHFNRIVSLVNNFVNTDLSSCYLHLVKDRLYCGYIEEHDQLRKILVNIYQGLGKSLWPITPFLIEESWSFLESESFYRNADKQIGAWNFAESGAIINSAMEARKLLYARINDLNTWNLNVVISGKAEALKSLLSLHPTLNEPVNNSELCEIFQVLSVKLVETKDTKLQFSYKRANEEVCPRCRRFTTADGVCLRCQEVLKEKNWIQE